MTTTGVNGSTNLSTTGTTLSTTGSSLSRAGNGMGQNDFLMLMMDQLKAQDPLNPSDPTQYMSELAQFTSLQTENNIATSTSQAAAGQTTASALSLLGHTVNYTDANGQTQTGTVSKVDFSTSGASLTIGSASGISLASVTEAS